MSSRNTHNAGAPLGGGDELEATVRAHLRRILRMSAVSLIVTAVALGLLGPWVLGHLTASLQKAGIAPDPGSIVAQLSRTPILIVLPALVAFASGVGMLATRRFTLILLTLGSLAIVVGIALVLACFVGMLAPMYQYQEL